jgi:hypothetical protein
VSRWQELQMPGADAGRPFDQQLVASLDNFAQGLRAILDRGIALGDNVDCEIVAFTSSATPDAELAVPHSLGKVPSYFIVADINKGGVVYRGATAFTSETVYLKCSAASAAVVVILI